MKYVAWDPEKNALLKKERSICFEDVVVAFSENRVITFIKHPGETRQHQYIVVVEINKYAYMVPFVEDEDKLFLETIIPSRKMTKKYLT
ncbi:MAG: BrnT family toxin [bacterium]|nr:BrnT family toxin [bacterium]